MKIISPYVLCLGVLLLSLANAASASVAFRFVGEENGVENVPLFPEDGPGSVTVVTTGHLVGLNDPNDAALSYITPLGLAVNNTTVAPDDRRLVPLTLFDAVDTFQVDSDGGGEFIRLVFSLPSQIELVYFTDAGPGERFSLIADGQVIDVPALFGTDEITKIHEAGMVEFPDSMPFATTYDFYSHSSFNLHNVHVDVIPEATAAFTWCGLGLALVTWYGLYRKRVKRSAASDARQSMFAVG